MTERKEAPELAPDRQFENFNDAVQAAMVSNAPLNERLGVVWDAVRTFRPRSAEAVSQLVDRLKNHAAGSTAPKVGDPMPGFLLPDERGRLVSLAGLLRDGPVVISFQRGHWCPYCRVSTIGLVEVQDEIKAAGAQLVIILPERRRFATMLKGGTGARFPFLSDMDNGYALSLDLVMWVGSRMKELMAETGIDLSEYQDNESWFLPIPATFVVGSDGVIVARYVDPDYRRRMEIADLLAAVRQAR
jgi:peroxiredoxin